MEIVIGVLLILVLVIIVFLIVELFKMKKKLVTESAEMRLSRDELIRIGQMVQQHMNTTNQTAQTLSEGFGRTLQKLEDVRNVAQSAQDLKNLFTAPKGRGAFGEVSLYALVKDLFPSSVIFEQFSFRSGQRVDLALKIGERLLSIDSKFPIEDFTTYYSAEEQEQKVRAKTLLRNIRKHIEDISTKYINPSEGTFDFAFMYVPAESIYYEICANPDFESEELLDFARRQRVYLVSPNTLHAYLAAVAYAVRASMFEKNVSEIIDALSELAVSSKNVIDEFGVLSKHISNSLASANRLNQLLVSQQSKLELVDRTLKSFTEEEERA